LSRKFKWFVLSTKNRENYPDDPQLLQEEDEQPPHEVLFFIPCAEKVESFLAISRPSHFGQ